MSATVYKGHDPTYGDDGTDVLVTVWDDGSMEVALRDGLDCTWQTWGPPVELADASMLRLVRGDVDGGRR